MSTSTSKPTIHILTYTHWDREFRWEFEHTRMKLVELMDNLLAIMEEKPAYSHYMLDGQVGLLDDYLEIRPENEPVIRKLVADGRLEIGPWYSLPDCAAVHGESIIRNLQYGVKIAKQYGDVMLAGHNVFSFGQIAQLPQLYKHFGIDTILFYKHMAKTRSRHPEFIWEAPDGTRAYASRLGPEARWNFFFAGHIPIVYGLDPWHKSWHYDYGDPALGKVVHTADEEGHGFFHEIVDPVTGFHPEKIEMGFERAIQTVQGTLAPETLLFYDGTDFTEPHPMTPEIVQALREKYGDQYEIKQSSLTAYLSELRAILETRKDQLDVVAGAMRDGPVGAIHTDVLNMHMEINRVNGATENRLIRRAEPLSTMAWALGIDRYPQTYLDKAWKLLFQSHPHDSVHGLGPHEITEGVTARIKQAGLIAQGVERKALNNLTKEIHSEDITDATVFLAVHNTAAFPRSEVVEAWVDIPAEIALKDVLIEDLSGQACELQEVSRETTRGGIYHARSRNMPFYCTRVHLLFYAPDVPAMGHKTFKIKWTERAEYPYPHENWDPPRIVENDLLVAPARARNNHVDVRIHADGTFDVTDIETNRTYAGLHYLLDQGDIGNMWMSDVPDEDAVIQSKGQPAEVSCTRHGALEVRFEITSRLRVPARFDFQRMKRSDEHETITAKTQLILRKDARHLEVRTEIDNTARDHYIKMCFPTGLRAQTTCADSALAVSHYPAKPDLRTDLARHPAQLWLDLHDGQNGLAILSRSTRDYEILDEADGQVIALSMVRGARLRVPCDNRLWMEYPGDESAQCLGPTVHEYAIMPHARSWDEAGLYVTALQYNQPLRSVQFGKQSGSRPAEASFLAVDNPNVVLSALIKDPDRESVLVRCFNPTEKAQTASLTLGFDVAAACEISLAGERQSTLPLEGNAVAIHVGKGQILTVEMQPEK
jgi:mannosylglycerate hydrolase